MAKRSKVKRVAKKKVAKRKVVRAPRKVSVQKLRDEHEGKLLKMRQQQANHFRDMMLRAKEIMENSANPAEEIAAAQQTYNDMQAHIARLSKSWDVKPT